MPFLGTLSRLWIALLVVQLAGPACTAPPWAGRQHARVPKYSWGFYNASGGGLTRVAIDYHVGDTPFHDGAGILDPSSAAESMDAPDPIPPAVTVTWRIRNCCVFGSNGMGALP